MLGLTVDIHAHTVVPEVDVLIEEVREPTSDPFPRFGGASTAHDARLAPTLRPFLSVGAEHVVLGSDHPFDGGQADPIDHLDHVPEMTVGLLGPAA